MSAPGTTPQPELASGLPSADAATPWTGRGINGRARKLKPHKRAKARNMPRGARMVTVWDVEGDESVYIQFKTGKQVHGLRLSNEAFDALISLRHPAGVRRWEYVVRAALAETPTPADEPGTGSAEPVGTPSPGMNKP